MSKAKSISVILSTPSEPAIGLGGFDYFVNTSGDNSFDVQGTGYTLEWSIGTLPSWATGTVVFGIVFGKATAATVSAFAGGGAGAFSAFDSSSGKFFSTHNWAPPDGAVADTDVLFLANSNSAWKVSINTSSLLGGTGNPNNGTLQKYLYRIYFYTPSIGLWYRDPEVDMTPMT